MKPKRTRYQICFYVGTTGNKKWEVQRSLGTFNSFIEGKKMRDILRESVNEPHEIELFRLDVIPKLNKPNHPEYNVTF